MVNHEQPNLVNCPRCGYDQRGTMVLWNDSCPVMGVCAECGLTFSWGELLGDRLVHPRWCVEADGSALGFPRRVVATLVRTFWPWSLWRNLRMTHQMRWNRLVAYQVGLLLVLYGAFALAIGMHAAGSYWQTTQLNPGFPGGRWVSTTSVWTTFFHGALMPWSNEAPGLWNMVVAAAPTTTSPMLAPIDFTREALHNFGVFPLIAMLAPAAIALAFAALPISRRRAKVKWSHIARAMLYSYPLIILGLVVMVLVYGMSVGDLPGVVVLAPLLGLYFLALPALLVLFWKAATTHYLRMEHGWAVALSVVVLGVLAPISLTGALWVSGILG